ncbi:MAG: diguanylate cyclase domain-containing protein [Bryobacteraceae bacterium]
MTLRILLVESDPEETLLLRDVLNEMDAAPCWSDWVHLETLHASTWSDAAAILATEPVDVVLLDPVLSSVTLPAGQEAETYRRVQVTAQHVPLILLIDPCGVGLAERLVRDGAQDFLLKQQVDCIPLAHAIRNAVERHRLLAGARAVSMTDPLTGLLSRAAFLTLADRDRKLAERLGCRLTVMVAEPANLDALTSTYGEQRHDLAMVETADCLRTLAGPADLLARIEADEFGLTIFETGVESAEEVWSRMHGAAAEHRISLGAAVFDPEYPRSLDGLLEQARLDLEPKALAMHR